LQAPKKIEYATLRREKADKTETYRAGGKWPDLPKCAIAQALIPLDCTEFKVAKAIESASLNAGL